jgi:hypothetical protein
MADMPVVPVYDLVVHPREGDLVAATHGRSLWILDNLGPLQQATDSVMAADVHLFQNKTATRWRAMSRGGERGHMLFQGRNPLTVSQVMPQNSPTELENAATIDFWLKAAPGGKVKVEIGPVGAAAQFTSEIEAHAGMNRFYWNLRYDPPQGGSAGGPRDPDEEGFGFFRRLGAPAPAGTYQVRLTVNGQVHETTVTVREDPDSGGIRSQ